MKITIKQLKRIIKESMDVDYYEFRHQEDQKELEDHQADVVYELIQSNERISGPDLVNLALRNSVFGGATARDVHEILDVLLEDGDVRFNPEEDEWSISR